MYAGSVPPPAMYPHDVDDLGRALRIGEHGLTEHATDRYDLSSLDSERISDRPYGRPPRHAGQSPTIRDYQRQTCS
jgi:hypothetical protein